MKASSKALSLFSFVILIAAQCAVFIAINKDHAAFIENAEEFKIKLELEVRNENWRGNKFVFPDDKMGITYEGGIPDLDEGIRETAPEYVEGKKELRNFLSYKRNIKIFFIKDENGYGISTLKPESGNAHSYIFQKPFFYAYKTGRLHFFASPIELCFNHGKFGNIEKIVKNVKTPAIESAYLTVLIYDGRCMVAGFHINGMPAEEFLKAAEKGE